MKKNLTFLKKNFSAGVGRSGSFILIDSMRRHLLRCDRINVQAHLKRIRMQRSRSVQTLVLYFLHLHIHIFILYMYKSFNLSSVLSFL